MDDNRCILFFYGRDIMIYPATARNTL